MPMLDVLKMIKKNNIISSLKIINNRDIFLIIKIKNLIEVEKIKFITKLL